MVSVMKTCSFPIMPFLGGRRKRFGQSYSSCPSIVHSFEFQRGSLTARLSQSAPEARTGSKEEHKDQKKDEGDVDCEDR